MPTHALTTTLTDDEPSASLEVTTPDGRVLLVTVTLSALDPDATPVVHGPAHVVYLDTIDWEPGPETLRVNVNDGQVFGYPDPNESPEQSEAIVTANLDRMGLSHSDPEPGDH